MSSDKEPTLTPGRSVTLNVSGFTPGEQVKVTLVGGTATLVADAAGTVTFDYTVPAGAQAGRYTVGFAGVDSGVLGAFVFDVVAPAGTPSPTSTVSVTATAAAAPSTRPTSGAGSTGALARTGASVAGGLALAAVLIGGGAGIVLSTRRRRAQES